MYKNDRGNRDLHFMNLCRHQDSVYTCAVDSFLEIAYSTFGPYIAEIETQSLFFDLLTNCLKSYSIILNSDITDNRENEENLSITVIWGYFHQRGVTFITAKKQTFLVPVNCKLTIE